MHRLKELEAARQLQAAREDADKLRLRLSQGQANYQGAALEADVADRLRQAFPADEISVVRSGQRGGDIMQLVRTASGATCGSILWEAKNTRQWQGTWLAKLRSDMRAARGRARGDGVDGHPRANRTDGPPGGNGVGSAAGRGHRHRLGSAPLVARRVRGHTVGA